MKNKSFIAFIAFGLLLLTPSLTFAATKPLVIARYFLSSYDRGEPIGKPLVFLPTQLQHKTGTLTSSGAIVADPKVSTDRIEFLSYGPYSTPQRLIARIKNNDPSVKDDKMMFSVVYEMTTDSIAFSSKPIATLDIFGTLNGKNRVLMKRDLYPQDFKTPNAAQKFSLILHYNAPYEGEILEFRVKWHKTQKLTLHKIEVEPLKFRPIYGMWRTEPTYNENGLIPQSSLPASVAHRKLFDPDWILTYNQDRNGNITPLATIDWSKRDIVMGHEGMYPYLGAYNQNEGVMRYHMQLAKAAGVDAFDLITAADARDSIKGIWDRIALAFTIAEQEDFKLFLDFQQLTRDFFLKKDASGKLLINPMTQAHEYDYDSIMANFEALVKMGFFDSSAYLRIDNRPVFFVPLPYEKDPNNIKAFVDRLNSKYKQISGDSTGLYLLFWSFNPSALQGVQYNEGPYNMETMFFQQNVALKYTFPNWQNYFTHNPNLGPTPQTPFDLLNTTVSKLDPTTRASGYSVFLHTLLNNPAMAGYRNTGVDAYIDPTGEGAAIWPRSWVVGPGVKPYLTALNGSQLSKKVYQTLKDDAHKAGLAAVVTITPGHDKRNFLLADIGYEAVPRLDDNGTTLRWERLVNDAVSVNPDIIYIKSWNGNTEAKSIEPTIRPDHNDPFIDLKILAKALGKTFVPPAIPLNDIDPLRAQVIAAQRYTVNVTATNGSVTISPTKSTGYVFGEKITVQAQPSAGYVFAGWSGDVTSSANPLTLTIDGNKNVVANFQKVTVPTGPAINIGYSVVPLAGGYTITVNFQSSVLLSTYIFPVVKVGGDALRVAKIQGSDYTYSKYYAGTIPVGEKRVIEITTTDATGKVVVNRSVTLEFK